MASEDQLRLLYDNADEAEHLEHAAAAAATLELRNRMQAVSQWLAGQWVARFGSLTVEAPPGPLHELLGELRQRIAAVKLDPSRIILLWGHQALALGLRQAAGEIGVATPLAGELGAETVNVAQHTTTAVDDRMRKADRMLTVIRGSKHDDVVPALAAAHAAVSDVDRAARWVVNREVNRGPGQIAETLHTDLLWIAERDACVVCLALSGTIATYGNHFDATATFGTKPPMAVYPPGELNRPPRHWGCRCRVTPWIGHDTEGARTASIPGWHKGQASANVSLAEALRREARRSVVQGYALPSESETERRRAADRLLQRGANLPKTVEQRARRRLRSTADFRQSVPNGA